MRKEDDDRGLGCTDLEGREGEEEGTGCGYGCGL